MCSCSFSSAPGNVNFPWDHAVVFFKKSNLNLHKDFFVACALFLPPLQTLWCNLYRNSKPWIMSSEIYCTFLQPLTWGTFRVCVFILVYLALTQRAPSSPLTSLHFVEKIMQRRKTLWNFFLNFQTTVMCAAANSLWLNNLPFSQTF